MTEIILCNPAENETSEQQYERIKNTVSIEVEPVIKEHLKSLDIQTKVKAANSMKELGEMVIDFVPLSVKQALAATLDTFSELTVEQKTWLFSIFLSSIFNHAQEYATAHLRTRAQELANRSRIFT